jgi:hypothetical protein
VVVQYVPTELKDKNREIMEAAEDSVGSGRGMVVSMKWMKNPQHWKEGQRYAHLILTSSVLKSSLVRFFASKRGNWQPQPV